MSVTIHPSALVETQKIGPGTRIWAFAHILPGALIGNDCNICDHTFIENDVVIGDRVTLKCGVQLWDGLVVEDDVFIGPNVSFTNDLFPRSKQYPEKFLKTVIQKGASIGANATILPGLTLGAHCMIGAGAVVTRSVPPYAIVVGNPARIQGYSNSNKSNVESLQDTSIPAPHTYPSGVQLRYLPQFQDLRGSLCVAEIKSTLPFEPQRLFFIFDVPSKEVRGEHAHRECHQFLICVKGSCTLVVDNGKERDEIQLDSARIGIHIPPLVWGVQYNYSQDAVLLVLASHSYDSKDYIRSYDEFSKITNK